VYTPASTPELTVPTIALISDILRGFGEAQVSPEDLAGAKEYIRGSLLLSAESSDNQMVRLAQNEMHYGRQIPLGDVIDKIMAVTPEDIRSLAAELMVPERMALTLLGPTATDLPLSGWHTLPSEL
jgi:predicted Zn-dependent peptidase